MEDHVKTEMWKKLAEHLEGTKEFVMEQAPDVIQQALRYEKIAARNSAIFMIGVVVVALGVAYYFGKHPSLDKYGSRDLFSSIGIFIPLVLTIPSLFQIYSSIDRSIKISVAPKYFLTELFIRIKR